jgi:hypothetical protein
MAQAARRLAWPSSEVEQAQKQARIWAHGLVELHERIGGRFGRVEPRRRALAYLNRTGSVGGSIAWKGRWSNGRDQQL